jgi:hypothetical protein
MMDLGWIGAAILLILCLAMVPAIIAFCRNHRVKWVVFVLTSWLFIQIFSSHPTTFGWVITLLFWLVLLIWSIMGAKKANCV